MTLDIPITFMRVDAASSAFLKWEKRSGLHAT